LSVSVNTVPQRVTHGQRHAVTPVTGLRRARFPGRRGSCCHPCRNPRSDPRGGGAEGADPAGWHGCTGRLGRLPEQPYTQRRSADVPAQSPVQRLPQMRESTAARPGRPVAGAGLAACATRREVPAARSRRQCSRRQCSRRQCSRHGRTRPWRAGAGTPLAWLMCFMVIYCRFIHNSGCSTLISSWKDILPTAAFRSQCRRDESSQVEFVAPNTPTVKRNHLMPVWPLWLSSATQIAGLTQMPK
jgi:hypothetical protein